MLRVPGNSPDPPQGGEAPQALALRPGDPGDPASRAAFEAVFLTYYPRLVRLFRRQCRSPEDAEDLTHQTLLRVFRFGGQIRDASEVWLWLFCIASNVLRNHRRAARAQKRSAHVASLDTLAAARSPRLERAVGEAAEAQDDALQAAIDRQSLERLREACGKLPPKMRRCLLMRLCHDLEIHQIAQLLGISEETVKAHLFQARSKLRRLLGSGYGLGGG